MGVNGKIGSKGSANDALLKAAPIWNSFAMMCATYSLYQAPFWDKLLQQGMGIEVNGSYQQLLVSCVNYGVMFSIVPGMLADRYSCFPTTLVGAGLSAIGYTILGMGWVTVGSGGSPRIAVAATVVTYAVGVAWIYASAFVTGITTADKAVRGRVTGVLMCGFYASSAWFTEVTEYCCNAETTAEMSAWRHLPIALTALICSPGLATAHCKSGLVSSSDMGMTSVYCGVLVAMGLGAYQWNVTGGFGSQDLSSFAYGDIPFAFLVGYVTVSTFCLALNVRNYAKYGIAMGGSDDEVSEKVEAKTAVPPTSTLESNKYRLLSAIFAIGVGLGQTTGNTWEYFDELFHWKQTESWKMWFPSMATGALVAGLLVDLKVVDKVTLLGVSTSSLTMAQFIFSMATVDASMTTTNWSFLTVPYEHIPLITTAAATGITCTVIPLLEIEWFGSKNIGGMHGIDMLGAIATQALFYNGVANVASLSTQMWLQTATAAAGVGCVLALRSQVASERARAAEETQPLVVTTTAVEE